MGKLVLGNLLRHLVTLLIGFFVARQMLSADVAAKLNAGDTVELWSGGWTISLKQVIDFLLLSAIPVIAPVAIGIWSRVKDKYRLLVARLSPKALTAGEVKEIIAETPTASIIKSVAHQPS